MVSENLLGDQVAWLLEDELAMMLAKYQFLADRRFTFEMNILGRDTSLLLVLFLPPFDFKIELGNDWPVRYRQISAGSIVFCRSAAHLACIVRKNQQLNAIIFQCTENWLWRRYPDGEKNMKALVATESPIFPMSPRINKFANEIYQGKNSHDRSVLKGIGVNIIDKFITQAIRKQQKKEHDVESYKEAIKAVEQKLISALYHELPSINELSKLALMSEASLKRHFRRVFGKPIYGYYLEKKCCLPWRCCIEMKKPFLK